MKGLWLMNPNSTVPQGPAAPRDPRILILSVSPDLSSSYIPLMNSIFSAQKLVRLLGSILRHSDTTFVESNN